MFQYLPFLVWLLCNCSYWRMIQFITRNKILTIYPILWQWLLHTVLDGNRLFISDSSSSVFWDSISSTMSSANEQDNIQLQLPIVSAGAKEEQWGDRSTNRRQDKMKLYHYNKGAFIIIQEQEGWTLSSNSFSFHRYISFSWDQLTSLSSCH